MAARDTKRQDPEWRKAMSVRDVQMQRARAARAKTVQRKRATVRQKAAPSWHGRRKQ